MGHLKTECSVCVSPSVVCTILCGTHVLACSVCVCSPDVAVGLSMYVLQWLRCSILTKDELTLTENLSTSSKKRGRTVRPTVPASDHDPPEGQVLEALCTVRQARLPASNCTGSLIQFQIFRREKTSSTLLPFWIGTNPRTRTQPARHRTGLFKRLAPRWLHVS